MSRILSTLDLQNASRCIMNTVDTSLWTCVIPAAGEGTRLSYNRPKVLYPILGKPILHHLVGLFQKYCSRFIVVASPKGAQEIQKELESCCNSIDFGIVIQEEPKGMAHAVWQARNITKTPHALLVREDTLQEFLTIHTRKPDAKEVGKKLYEYLSQGKTLVEIFEEPKNPLLDLLNSAAERLGLSKEFLSWYFERVVKSRYLRSWNRRERKYNWLMNQSLGFYVSFHLR